MRHIYIEQPIGNVRHDVNPFYNENGFIHFIGKKEKAKPRDFCEPEKSHIEYQSIMDKQNSNLSDKMEENNLTAFDYKISASDIYVMGVRSGKSNMLYRAMRAVGIMRAYREELNNVMKQTTKTK